MNHARTIFFFLAESALFLLLLTTGAIGATWRYVDVAPGVGTLNAAIDGDTLANGARVDTNTIYRLQRGPAALYLLQGTIKNTFPLRIEAAAGTGEKPKIMRGLISGGVSYYPLYAYDDIYLKNIFLTTEDESGALEGSYIRVYANNVRVTVDSCILYKASKYGIRVEAQNASIFLKNTVMGIMASDWNNGRGIDDRGNNLDTLVIENCTFFNCGSRYLRDSGGYLDFAFINHNIFMNAGLRVVELKECPNATFTNNIVYNCGFLGYDKTDTTNALLMIKPLTSARYQGVQQKVKIAYNNFYNDPTFAASYPANAKPVPRYNSTLQSLVDKAGFESTNITEALTFTLPPPSVKSLIGTFWADPLQGSGDASGLIVSGPYNYDFAYNTTASSYTHGADKKPLGSLMWFHMIIDGVEGSSANVPGEFQVAQNYPNPFNPATTIRYQVPWAAKVTIKVFNLIGQEVATLVNAEKQAGQYTEMWNASNVPSGIYFCRTQAVPLSGTMTQFSAVRKMVLLK